MSRAGGRFIVLEGLDGAGTTTQARLLGERLRAAGAARPTSPRSRRAARSARCSARCCSSGSTAGPATASTRTRWRCSSRPIGSTTSPPRCCPRLAAGEDVVSDRYTLSSLAYQSLTTGDPAWVETINGRARAPT